MWFSLHYVGLVRCVRVRSGQSLHCRWTSHTTALNGFARVYSMDSMDSPINSKIHLAPACCRKTQLPTDIKKKRAATASACREPNIIEVVFQFIYLYTPYHHYSLKGLNRHHIYDMSNQQLALITQALACIHFLRKEEEEGGLAVNVA